MNARPEIRVGIDPDREIKRNRQTITTRFRKHRPPGDDHHRGDMLFILYLKETTW